ncbi:hypothetical protein ACFL2Q_09995 [Thermodesulfobacteriota bacterium]
MPSSRAGKRKKRKKKKARRAARSQVTERLISSLMEDQANPVGTVKMS